MVDLTMCSSMVCDHRDRCKRNVASGTEPADLYQSWSKWETYDTCGSFLPVDPPQRHTSRDEWILQLLLESERHA